MRLLSLGRLSGVKSLFWRMLRTWLQKIISDISVFLGAGEVSEWSRSCSFAKGIASHNFEANWGFSCCVGRAYSPIISMKCKRQYNKQSISSYYIYRKFADTSIGMRLVGVNLAYVVSLEASGLSSSLI